MLVILSYESNLVLRDTVTKKEYTNVMVVEK